MKFIVLFSLPLLLLFVGGGTSISIEEATIDDIHKAFKENQLTARTLVEFYLNRIKTVDPQLNAVIEVNPDALADADEADRKRRAMGGSSSGLQGIPILLKDNIATADRMNTTAGSLALLGSVVPRDAGVVRKLRVAGAIILGKASLSEWSEARSPKMPLGWCARSGQGHNPYLLSYDPCGSSSGSAIAVAANLAMVSLGTETDGSILCPSTFNSVVGIKPTVGLTSRAGVIPISRRQDTVGPICRTVSDAVHVLDAIVGFDSGDTATGDASKLVPPGGYKKFLKATGLKGKRLGILRKNLEIDDDPAVKRTYAKLLKTLREKEAVLVDNLEIANQATILDPASSGEAGLLLAELKLYLNEYLNELRESPVRSLSDIIAFNNNHPDEEKTKQYGQKTFEDAEKTNGFGEEEKRAVEKLERLSKDGIEKLMKEKNLDAIVSPEDTAALILAIGGYPGISVPAGYDDEGIPIGICFGGLKGYEPRLIEIAYGFEQATKVRKPPTLKPK